MRVLTGTPQAASTGSRYSEVVLVGDYIVRAVVVSNAVGTDRPNTCEPAKIIVYDTPDARQHGCQIAHGYVGGFHKQMSWTGVMPVNNGAIRAFVVLDDSAQVGLFVVVD